MFRDQYWLFGLTQVCQDFCSLALKVCNKFNFHGLTLIQIHSDTIVSLFRRSNRSIETLKGDRYLDSYRILAASSADINIAFCRTHDGISQVLRGTLVSVPEKATNALQIG